MRHRREGRDFEGWAYSWRAEDAYVGAMRTRFRLLAFALVVCLHVAAPARLSAQQTVASVACKDGTTSKGQGGTCSHHGGRANADPLIGSKKSAKEPEAFEVGTRFRCNDGSSAPKGRGACSHHGGVDKAAASDNPRSLTAARSGATSSAPRTDNSHSEPMSAPNAALPGVATARCKDGTLSAKKRESGICSNHGGVEQWLDGPSR
jgi:hypothetical protein